MKDMWHVKNYPSPSPLYNTDCYSPYYEKGWAFLHLYDLVFFNISIHDVQVCNATIIITIDDYAI